MDAQIPPKVDTELRDYPDQFRKVLENCWAQLGHRAAQKQTSEERLLEVALIFAGIRRDERNRLSWEEWKAILQKPEADLRKLLHENSLGADCQPLLESITQAEVIARFREKYTKSERKLNQKIEKFKRNNPGSDTELKRRELEARHEEQRRTYFLNHHLSCRIQDGRPFIGLLIQEILLQASREVLADQSELTISLKTANRKDAPPSLRGAYLGYYLRSKIEDKLRARRSRPPAPTPHDQGVAAVEAALTGLNIDPKQEDALGKACRAFCEAFASDLDLQEDLFCHLGFYRDHYFNATEYLYDPVHMKYPEVSNFAWRQGDLPTTLLMRERALLYPPFPTGNRSMQPDSGKFAWQFDRVGRFQYREDTDYRRVLCFRLEWSPQAAPVVLFLNWRQGKDGELPGKEFLHQIWDAVDQALAEEDPEKREKALRRAVFPLKPAAIYFQEWLDAHRIESPAEWKARQRRREGAPLEPKPMEPLKVCRSVKGPAASPELSRGLGTLADCLNDALGLREVPTDGVGRVTAGLKKNDCRVYEVAGEWNEDPRKDGRYVVFPVKEKEGLRTPEGDEEVPSQCLLRIETDEKKTSKGKPVKRKTPRMGSCATACLWRTALLLHFPEGRATTELTKLCIQRADVERRAEIVVPILDDQGLAVAVVNWVSSEPLKREKIRNVEVITHLFQRLRAIYMSGNKDWDWMEAQLSDKGPKTSQGILKAYCKEVRQRLEAALVRVLIYDARSGILIPQGISLSQSTASLFLENERGKVEGEKAKAVETLEKAYRGDAPFADFRDKPAYKGLFDEERNALENLLGRLDRHCPKDQDYQVLRNALHALLEHAISLRLITRHHGNTWNTLVDQEPHFIPDVEKSTDVNAEARQYFRAIMGIPFRHHPNAQAAGVLAVSWGKEDRVGDPELANILKELQGETLPKEHAEARRNEFIRAVEARVGRITEAVAAVHNLFRYCDPEAAIDILPP